MKRLLNAGMSLDALSTEIFCNFEKRFFNKYSLVHVMFVIIDPTTKFSRTNKMPAILALRVMLGLIHLFQLYASPIDKTILANGIV